METVLELWSYMILPIIMLLLIFVYPVVACFYNIRYAKSACHFLVYNIIFLICQAVGYYSTGMLYYNIISSDYGTLYITNEGTVFSVIYIAVITLIGFVIKRKNMQKADSD